MGTSKRPSRRPLRREEGDNVRSNARSTISVETVARKPAQPTSAAAIIAGLEAELAREKGARVLDADRMGEMLVRIAEAENEKRRAELSARELSERLGTLEVELGHLRKEAKDRSLEADLAPALAAAERQLRDEHVERTLLQERVTRLESDSNRMVTQLELAEASAEAAHEQLAAVRAEADQLRTERDRHQGELGELLAQLEEARRALEMERGERERLASELARSIGEATRHAADAKAATTAASEASHAAGEKNAALERLRKALLDLDRDDRSAAQARSEAMARLIATIAATEPPVVPAVGVEASERTPSTTPETLATDAPILAQAAAPVAQPSTETDVPASALPEIPSFSEFAPPGPATQATATRRPSRAPRRSTPPKSPPTMPAPAKTAATSVAFVQSDEIVLDALDIEE